MNNALNQNLRRLVLACSLACQLPMLYYVPWLAALLIVGAALAAIFSQRKWPMILRLLAVGTLGIFIVYSFNFSLGRDTASAGLMAMLSLKFSETFTTRDAKSLLGFSLFAPFAAFLQSQNGVLLFACALIIPLWIFTLAALNAAHRPIEWKNWMPQARSLIQTLLIALPLALAGFWLFPRLSSPLWGMPNNAQAKTGISDSMRPGQWIDLFSDDNPAFRVKFANQALVPSEKYWRGPVLWNFDGVEWKSSYFGRNLPAESLQKTSAAIQQTIWLEPTEQRFIFALDVPGSLGGAGELNWDRSGYAQRRIAQLIQYQATSYSSAQSNLVMPNTIRQVALDLPDGFNPRTKALAQQWRAEGLNDAQIIQRSLQWFNKEFSYSLAAPLLGRNGVDQFLFDDKIGYCEYFSSAFVVLMREAGIPARVVTGYAGGVYNPVGEYWIVRNSDAHAWAEVWLPNRGWARVDPTAAVAPERVFETVEDLQNADDLGFNTAFNYTDWMSMAWNNWMLGFNAERQRMLLTPFGKNDLANSQFVLLVGLGFALSLGFTVWLLMRERDSSRTALLKAWDKACKQWARLGFKREAHESAVQFAARIKHQQQAAFKELACEFNQLRYATSGEVSKTDLQTLIDRLKSFRLNKSG